MNALAAEIALRLESAQIVLTTEHFCADLNVECDALSRLAQGKEIPSRLLSVARALPRSRVPSFFWAWPREILEAQ